MGRVAGKVALVTGGALGLGKAAAEMLAREGAKVVVTDVNVEEGRKTAQGIAENGGEAIFVQHDASSEEQWKAAIQAALDAYGRLDILVNNAGIGFLGTVEDTTLEAWRKTQSVNLDGVFLGTKYGIEAMRKSGGGSIINLSSQAGHVAANGRSVYTISKFAVEGMTKALAVELAPHGIRVNSLCPTFIDTEMTQSSLADQAFRDAVLSRIRVGRLGKVEDLMGAVVFLASDASALMTGASLMLDGGWTA